MSKKHSKKTVSDASDAREADQVVTAEDLVIEPEAPAAELCSYCTAEIGDDGICTNCGKPFAA